VTSAPGRAERPGLTFLRIPAIRWLIAELIPFGCLAVGFTIINVWPAGGFLGFAIAVFAGIPATVLYLYKVLGAAIAWVWPIMVLMLASTFVGGVIFAGSTMIRPGHGTKVVITSTWWLIGECLALLLALTVAAAIANGERWMRRNRSSLPRNEFETFAKPRGTLARLWLPR
jgi:hypothetical protein